MVIAIHFEKTPIDCHDFAGFAFTGGVDETLLFSIARVASMD